MVSSETAAEDVESSLATIGDMEDIDEWQDLPAEITALIQDQPGLKFNIRRSNSREDLERAYDLLHDFIPGWGRFFKDVWHREPRYVGAFCIRQNDIPRSMTTYG